MSWRAGTVDGPDDDGALWASRDIALWVARERHGKRARAWHWLDTQPTRVVHVTRLRPDRE